MDRLENASQVYRMKTREEKKRVEPEEKMVIPKSMILELIHEVRNPLSLIKNTAQLIQLKKGKVDPKYLKSISTEVDRVNRILEDFVTLARSHKSWGSINLNFLLREIYDLLEGEGQANNISVSLNFEEEDLFTYGHLDQLKQVLINLTRNSLEAMKTGGSLSFKLCKLPGEIIQIQIKDTGTGISPEIVAKIFDPYFSTKEGGTGLGLAICKRIIEEHKGEIYVKNNPDNGCTFYINLPKV